jgi:type IV secretory pathway TrbF-like protein
MEEHLVNDATSIIELATAMDSHLGNPYLNARKEWDERYGSLIKRAQHWRGAAVLALLVALAEAVVILGVATRPKTVPYVVAVDSLGRVVASGAVERSSPVDQRMEAIALTRWIQDLRGVTSDGLAQRKAIDRVYAMVGSGTAAQTLITEFYRANQPFERANKETVQVDVNTILPTTEHTYEVDWTETARDPSGGVVFVGRWKAILTVAVNPPTDENVLQVNPFGIYVMNVNWSKVV